MAALGNKNAVGNPGGGRPSEFKQEYVDMAYKIALLGCTDAELGDIFDVTEQTINNWKSQFPDFFLALKKGKQEADANVVSKLYQRAIGYTYDEVTFEKLDSKGSLEVTDSGDMKKEDTYKKKVVTKDVAPDTTAQIFWLKNRQRSKWADSKQIEQTVNQRTVIIDTTGTDSNSVHEEASGS